MKVKLSILMLIWSISIHSQITGDFYGASGWCGPNVRWTWEGRFIGGTLNIFGTGPTYDYHDKPRPWDSITWLREECDYIRVYPGVTTLGNNLLQGMTAPRIDLPYTLTSIGSYALSNAQSSNLSTYETSMVIGPQVNYIGPYAFSHMGSFFTYLHLANPTPFPVTDDIFYTPTVVSGNDEEHKKYRWFQTNGRLVIPAASKELYEAHPVYSHTTIVPYIFCEGIFFDKDTVEITSKTYSCKPSFIPEQPGDTRVWWESSNPQVAEVDGSGVVTAKSKGQTTITAITQQLQYSAQQVLNVEKGGVDSLKFIGISKDSVVVLNYTTHSQSTTLNVGVYPSNSYLYEFIKFWSSDPSVVKIEPPSLSTEKQVTITSVGDSKEPITIYAQISTSYGVFTDSCRVRIKSNDCTLASLKVFTASSERTPQEYTLAQYTPDFSPNRKNYTLFTESHIDSAYFIVEPTDQRAVVTLSRSGNFFPIGQPFFINPFNAFTIDVTSESGLSNYYVFEIEREVHYIKNLTVKAKVDTGYRDITNQINFDRNLFSYKLTVPHNYSEILLIPEMSTKTRPYTISGSESTPLKYGLNTHNLKITAIKAYEFQIYREHPTQLKSLTVSEGALTPEFNPDILKYNLSLNSAVKELFVNATSASHDVRISGTGKFILYQGDNGQIKIEGVTPDKNKFTYRINVFVEGMSTGLSDITQDTLVDVFTLTGIYLGNCRVSDIGRLKSHKVVIIKDTNQVIKVKL